MLFIYIRFVFIYLRFLSAWRMPMHPEIEMAPSIRSRMCILLLISFTASWQNWAACAPLFADSRWIVDGNGNRVKLACVNWASHLDTAIPEGLHKRPVDEIAKTIPSLGFNCVRLTWALFPFTDPSLGRTTVKQSLRNLKLSQAEAGIRANNPRLLDLSLVEAYKAVVSSIASNGLLIILENYNSKPGAVNATDGNGFFGDRYFDPDVWVKGLSAVATAFKGSPQVVGLGLRNALRGPRQNQNDWYKYIQRGAEAVHSANPDVLVILSGLDSDTDLSFLSNKPLDLTFRRKVVYELQWYAASYGQDWASTNPNKACAAVTPRVIKGGGFLLNANQAYTAPVILSEFGIDSSGADVSDNRYINCLLVFAADNDLDWALWALQGSYYYLSGKPAVAEPYGVLDANWKQARNASFLGRLGLLQKPLTGPGFSVRTGYKIIYHPATGLCLQRRPAPSLEVYLAPCTRPGIWRYTPPKTLVVVGTYFCIQAHGAGRRVDLAVTCVGESTQWNEVSDSKLQLSVNLGNGTQLCLDGISSPEVVSNPCKCLSGNCDPESQWFSIVTATRDY